MTVVLWVAATMLSVAALLALVRIVRGPSALDRIVAMDVLLSCMIGAIGLEAAYGRHGTTIPVLAVLALLGFVGSVAVARFGAGLGDDDPDVRAVARARERVAARTGGSSDEPVVPTEIPVDEPDERTTAPADEPVARAEGQDS